MENEEKVPMGKKEDPRQKQLDELYELRDECKKDFQFHEDRLKQYENSLVEAERFRHKSVVERLNANQGKSPAGKHEEILRVPMVKVEQLKGNIKNTKLALETLNQKLIGYGGAINAILAEIEEERKDAIGITAFKELMKSIDFFKIADTHYHDVAIPAINEAYEADSQFFDVNDRAMRLGLHKLLSHVIANCLKMGATENVSLDTIIRHLRHNFDSEGIENMLLPRTYDKDVDVDLYREHF